MKQETLNIYFAVLAAIFGSAILANYLWDKKPEPHETVTVIVIPINSIQAVDSMAIESQRIYDAFGNKDSAAYYMGMHQAYKSLDQMGKDSLLPQ